MQQRVTLLLKLKILAVAGAVGMLLEIEGILKVVESNSLIDLKPSQRTPHLE